MQSPLLPQAAPGPQRAGQAIPQSTSPSPPFFTPSSHAGIAQVRSLPAPPSLTHTWLAQSSARSQALPSRQGAHAGPPQSFAVSPPFFTPSSQVAAAQERPAQTWLSHPASSRHSTHAPAPSHTLPEPSAQGARMGRLSSPHCPP